MSNKFKEQPAVLVRRDIRPVFLIEYLLSLKPLEFVLPLSIRTSQLDPSYIAIRVIFIGVQARTNFW